MAPAATWAAVFGDSWKEIDDMITITKPKKALVVTTSPVRSSMARSFTKMMRACSAQPTARGARATGVGRGALGSVTGAGLSADADMCLILREDPAFWDPFHP